METIQLIIENATAAEAKIIRDQYNHHLDYANKVDKWSMLWAMENLAIWNPWKVGRGGNHIWISNQKNERLAIITFTITK